MAHENAKVPKSVILVVVYSRNTVEIEVKEDVADQVLKRVADNANNYTFYFADVDISGRPFRVTLGSPALCTYVRDVEPNLIVVSKRSDDIHAYLKGRPEIWGAGKSQYEAIGSLISAHGDAFNTAVESV